MFFNRMDVLAAINFIETSISKDEEGGKNCLFVRVSGDKLILTGGNEYVVKKAILISENTIDSGTIIGRMPETFMIPRPDLIAFRQMMKEHKAVCKKLSKSDPSYLFVEINSTQMKSHDGEILYQQPSYQFKDLEALFQISKRSVSEFTVVSADIVSGLSGFNKSSHVSMFYSANPELFLFEQEYLASIVIAPVEISDEDNVPDNQLALAGINPIDAIY